MYATVRDVLDYDRSVLSMELLLVGLHVPITWERFFAGRNPIGVALFLDGRIFRYFNHTVCN